MPGGHDARDLVHGKADVIVPGLHRLAGVHADAHANPSVFRPRVALDGALCIGRGHHSARGSWEGREDRVALSAENAAAGGGNGRGDQLAVFIEQARVAAAEGLQQARRTLDIREQEGRRARRASGHAQKVSNLRSVPGHASPMSASDWSSVLAESTCLPTWLRNWRACLSAGLTSSLK